MLIMTTFEELDANEDWRHARRKLLYQEVVCLVKRCSVDLLSFEDVRKSLHLQQRIYRGFQEIPLEQIRGSVGRFDDFSSAFLPRKDHMRVRWEGVDVAMVEGKTPPIEVYQVDQAYFVVDGNHRVSVARQRGLETIEAYVTEFPTQAGLSGEADIDEVLIKSEQTAFLEKSGEKNAETTAAMVFTCSGCYDDVTEQVEIYRQGAQAMGETSMTFEQAFSSWHDEVYEPAIEAIRHNDLIAQFPDRTEADLYIWAWQNNKVLEDLDQQDISTPDKT